MKTAHGYEHSADAALTRNILCHFNDLMFIVLIGLENMLVIASDRLIPLGLSGLSVDT